MQVMRRGLLVGFVFFVAYLGLAGEVASGWKTVQAGDLCLRVPEDWYDITPLARLLLLPELFSEIGVEGIAVPAAIARLPSDPEGEPALFLLFFVDAAVFQPVLATLAGEPSEAERTEGTLAGEPGIYEKYRTEDPEGLAWFAYTSHPRADGRHVVVLATSPSELPIPETVIQEMLLSLSPCPPLAEPISPERLALLERRLEELALTYTEEIQRLRERVEALERAVEALREARTVRLGIVDVETLFTRVFLSQAAAERVALEAKAQALSDLQSQYVCGRIGAEAYHRAHVRLQAEYLGAQIQVSLALLEAMLASPGFLRMRADLMHLRDQAQLLADQVEAVLQGIEEAVLDPLPSLVRLFDLRGAFGELDRRLTQAGVAKIQEIAQYVAVEQGCDLVVRTQDLVFFQEATVVDLTPAVERRLREIFPQN